MRRALLLLLAAAWPTLAVDQWVRLASPDFEVYTTAGEREGREAIRLFEEVRGFFLKASPVRSSSDFPVRIVIFSSPADYRPYSGNAIASAFFTSDAMRDYIVMSKLTTNDYPVAIHEYMHLIVRHSGIRLPVWLNEGWADVFSTLRPLGKEAAVGDLIPERIKDLEHQRWLDFDTLTSVDSRSPIYNESARVGIFYAESWALTHMLYLSPDYQDNFGKFVLALNSGKSAADALQIAWGRTPDQVFADLRTYFDRKRIYGRAFATNINKPGEEPVYSVVPSFESRLALADLLAASGKADLAKTEYTQLDQEQQGRADVSGSIGYLALRLKDRETARLRFEQALSEGTTDARLCVALAGLEREAGQPPRKRIPALERALKLRPGYEEAGLQLGLTQVEARQFSSAVATLMAIPTVTPEQATPLFQTLAFAKLQTGDLEGARHDIETALKYARTPAQKAGADQIQKLIDSRSKGVALAQPGERTKQAQGILRRIDCAAGSNHLLLQSGDEIMTFDLPPANAVEFTGVREKSFSIKCGQQASLPVVVEFVPSAKIGIAGVIRRLEY
jgi:hypothetical protein